ncbi:hypothetical protein A3F66_04395 [candidate division TM6 bacterium RIFCSPHIGHO2_12_FULL_32_22]|nr:MAG: hypothetical protein A3F66_04395 [candidate division TM6 bacterium RIFCSPHIGHO2_12_FULL_32_22]
MRRRPPVKVILSIEELNRFSMFYEVLIKVEKRLQAKSDKFAKTSKKAKRRIKERDSSSSKWSTIHFYLEDLYVKILDMILGLLYDRHHSFNIKSERVSGY